MSSAREFHDLLESTEIMLQVKNSLEDEPVKLLKEICRQSGPELLP